MAQDSFVVEVDDAALSSFLHLSIEGLEHPAPLMLHIGQTLAANINDRFGTKTDPSGAPWAPLSEATLKRKKGVGSILEFTGRMKSQIVVNPSEDSVEVGFSHNAPYAQFHETGTERMPRRGLLFGDLDSQSLGEQDRGDVIAAVNDYLADLGFGSDT